MAVAGSLFLLAGRARSAAVSSLPAFSQDDAQPPVARTLGPVNSYSCLLPANQASAQAEALTRLSAKAVAMGATGIIDVRYKVIKYAPRSPCWRQTYAKGVAVLLQPPTSPAQ
jgi:hypothetical protein